MSLEAALQENTSVMRELIARLGAAGVTLPATDAVASSDDTAAETKREKKPAPDHASKPPQKAEPAFVPPDYEKDVRPLLVKVSTGKGRDALVSLLSQFGAAKGDQLKTDQFTAVITAANELLVA